MKLRTLILKANQTTYSFYVTGKVVPLTVAGVVFNNTCHLFEADTKPGFDTSGYRKLIKKVKAKHGVGVIREHAHKQLIINETGKQFAIEGKCLKTNKDISEWLMALLSST